MYDGTGFTRGQPVSISAVREDIREIRNDNKSIVAMFGVIDVELAKLMDGF